MTKKPVCSRPTSTAISETKAKGGENEMTSWCDIEEAKKAFLNSMDRRTLNKHYKRMQEVLADNWADDKNRKSAEAFKRKTALKALALKYFEEGYEQEDLDALKRYAESELPEAERLGLRTTAEAIRQTLRLASEINEVMKDAYALTRSVRDENWHCVARSAEVCREVAKAFEAKAQALDKLKLTGNVFGEDVTCPDFIGEALSLLRQEKEFAEKKAEEIEREDLRRVLGDKVSFLNNERAGRYEVSQRASALNGKVSHVHVLCTPFIAELILFVPAHMKEGGGLASVKADDLVTMKQADRRRLAEYLVKNRTDVIVTGFNAYLTDNACLTDKAAEKSIAELLAFGKKGRNVYIMDDGWRKVYDAFVASARVNGSGTDVDFAYLKMPEFGSVIKRLQDKGIIGIGSEDAEYVRKNFPFMGYVGLNDILSSPHTDWKRRAGERTEMNKESVKKYIKTLPDKALFIDEEWGDFTEYIAAADSGKRLTFDYDDVDIFQTDKNIRKITDNTSIGVMAKCGLISEYCLLHGSDKSTWQSLTKEEMSKRITEATILVLRTLGINKTTKVEVLDKLDRKKAGGLCYNGGERIVYKYSSVKSYDWLRGAICHESFHALQHKAMYTGWFDWLYDEFGVTRGRVKQWRVNYLGEEERGLRGKYFDIDTDEVPYLVQLYEADARAFEFDCAAAAAAAKHMIDFA